MRKVSFSLGVVLMFLSCAPISSAADPASVNLVVLSLCGKDPSFRQNQVIHDVDGTQALVCVGTLVYIDEKASTFLGEVERHVEFRAYYISETDKALQVTEYLPGGRILAMQDFRHRGVVRHATDGCSRFLPQAEQVRVCSATNRRYDFLIRQAHAAITRSRPRR